MAANQIEQNLPEALLHCKLTKSTLVIAKLDRLSRNVEFLVALMNSDVKFIAADNPNATNLTIHILAAVAEEELSAIKTRTKAALQAAKARGVVLGNPNSDLVLNTDTTAARAARTSATKAWNADMRIIIADELNSRGFTTRRHSQLDPTAIKRILAN